MKPRENIRTAFVCYAAAISFPEAAILLVSTKKTDLGEIGMWASMSHSGYFLYACWETVIELERRRIFKPESGFLVSVFDFVQSVSRLVTLTENARDLGTRSMQLLFWRHAVFNEKCGLISAKDTTSLRPFNRVPLLCQTWQGRAKFTGVAFHVQKT